MAMLLDGVAIPEAAEESIREFAEKHYGLPRDGHGHSLNHVLMWLIHRENERVEAEKYLESGQLELPLPDPESPPESGAV